MTARSSSVDADRRPTLPKMDRLGGGQVWGRNARVETSGRLDIKHRQRLAAFISAPFLHFRTPFCEPAAPGRRRFSSSSRNAANPDLRIPSLRKRSTWMRLRGAQALRRGRRRISGGPFALVAPPNSEKQGPDLYESKDASSDDVDNDELKRVGRSAFISACHPREGLDDRCIPRSV
jgi:hypothetical protein